MPAPLTLGTAGHVDHGKTALVAALCGVDTDRLPEERERGITITLGYAPLDLPSGRRISLVDVPGHERFVRTMVAGATGIDCFLMTVAADDGVMPQTVEHATVLRALGVERGIVVVTKSDLADPGPATDAARELLPGLEVVTCSARTGQGIAEVTRALDQLAAAVPGRAAPTARDGTGGADDPVPRPAEAGAGDPVLHVDRSFTVPGRGTVVTGTLWSGEIVTGAALELLPGGTGVRVRGVEVHDRPVERAAAGQRVAANLVGVRSRDVTRGDVLAAPGALTERRVLDCVLALSDARGAERVHIHHGTRETPGRLMHLAEDLFQLRLEGPLMARDGDRVVVRRLAPPDTLGGGVILDAGARRHGARADHLDRLRRRRDGVPEPDPPADGGPAPGFTGNPTAQANPGRPAGASARHSAASAKDTGRAARPAPGLQAAADRRAPALPAAASALEERLRAAGASLLLESVIEDPTALRALRDAGRAVRVAGRLYGHAEPVADANERIVALIARDGSTSLAEVRDALGISRKPAQALLEQLDARRVTRRRPDDRRVLARRAAGAR